MNANLQAAPVVTVRGVQFGNDLPISIIAGPCQLESRAHALEVAGALKEIADRLKIGLVYKTSFDKANRTSLKGKLIGTDPKTDLAVFQAQNLAKKLTPAKFGNSAALRVGDTVLAIGSPLGLDGSVTSGIVSALNRTIDESSDSQPPDPFGQQGQQNQNSTPRATIAGAIQTDAAINPGNSGGALVNTNGEVVGINTAIATDGSSGNIGVGFAIPSNRANTVSQDIIKGVAVQHPFLGIGVVTANGNGGAAVQQVTSGSPAASAGLKVNDVITAYNGQPVHTSNDLINDVQGGNVNDQVTLTVQRGGSSTQVKVTLGESK